MNIHAKTKDHKTKSTHVSDARMQLLSGVTAGEQWLQLAGVTTPILEGGSGSPVILLHGPGESALWWMRVIPELMKTHRVIVPDLPGHGASVVEDDNPLDSVRLFTWLEELIDNTCSTPPALVGHILGGSLAARFAVDHGSYIGQLVLVNSLGLAPFRPAPVFAYRLIRFMMRPNEKTYNSFMAQCMLNPEDLRMKMGKYWEPFVEYNLKCARDADHKTAMQVLMKEIGIPKIPEEDLARIDVPVSLIWGRHDRANKLQIAETTSERYKWPLYVIENTRDDPKLERPKEFTDALHNILSETNENNLK